VAKSKSSYQTRSKALARFIILDCRGPGFSVCWHIALDTYQHLVTENRDFLQGHHCINERVINWKEQKRRVVKQHSELRCCHAVCATTWLWNSYL